MTTVVSRLQLSENTVLAILAVIIGVLAGLGNYALRQTIDLIHQGVIVQGMAHFAIDTDAWDWNRLYLILFPLCGGILMIPMGVYYAKDLRFGFSRFLEEVNLGGGKVPSRTIFTRGLASAITIGTGGSAGQEGPIAQIGGAIGSKVGQSFRMGGDYLKTLVACGAASGVAATFNAPIAGVFFAHEIVLLSSFELSSFTSIVIASGMSTVVSRALLGDHPEFDPPAYEVGSLWELGFYVLLGVLVGLLAATFMTWHYRIKDLFAALKLPRLAKPVLGGLLVGIIGVCLPQVFGNGYVFIEQVLHGHGVWYILAALVVMKAIATSITLGSGLPGGVFAPSLFLGAVAGGTFGKLLQFAFPTMGISSGAFAMVGMGGFLAAATHAPMTGIFLLFEITSSYQVIVPIMLTCVIGVTICRRIHRYSLETYDLARAGIDLEAGKERNVMKSLLVGAVMNRAPAAVPENMTLREFTQFVADHKETNFPLVNERNELTGILSVQDFMGVAFEEDLMDLVVIKEIATHNVITAHEDEDLDQAMRKIGYRNIEQLPVVDRETHRRLIGIISRRDIISAYNRALLGRSLKGSSRD
ncbi:MAG: chloride channel protein [Deltaproteobacteria bacterium]|nr:MAG: chloride channel protein [Deltaproteobacteria bacterium]